MRVITLNGMVQHGFGFDSEATASIFYQKQLINWGPTP